MTLSPRAQTVLATIQYFADPETGLVDVDARGRLHDHARVSRITWRRGMEELVAIQLVQTLPPLGLGPARIQLTPEGRATPPGHGPPLARAMAHPGPPLRFPLPSSSSWKNQEKEEEEEGGPPPRATPGHGPAPWPDPLPYGVTISLPLDPIAGLAILRPLVKALEEQAKVEVHHDSRPPNVAHKTPRPSDRLRLPAKDHNGWEAKDVEVSCCGSSMVARRNRKDDEWFGFCVSCKRRYDPAKEGRERGRAADQAQVCRARARA